MTRVNVSSVLGAFTYYIIVFVDVCFMDLSQAIATVTGELFVQASVSSQKRTSVNIWLGIADKGGKGGLMCLSIGVPL